MKRLWVIPFIAFLCIIFMRPVSAEPNVRVFFDGNEILYDIQPQIIFDRTMVPLRYTIEAITGREVEWDDKTKTATFYAGGHINKHTVGDAAVYVDGVKIEFPTPSLIIDGRTLVPIRMIAETSGCEVDWDGENYYVMITSPDSLRGSAKPEINSVAANKTTITYGESVTLTIKTNSGANHVWVNYDDNNAAAELKSESAGIKTWSVYLNPSKSQTLTVYAGTLRSSARAASKTLTVSVKIPSVTIESLSLDKTSIEIGDSIALTVKTNSAANNVWVNYDNDIAPAEYRSADAFGIKTWTVTIYPEKTQTISVFANIAQAPSGAAVKKQDITVDNSASIISVSANKITLKKGEPTALTIKTNSRTMYVWVVYEGNIVKAAHKSTDSSGVKTWTVNCYPSRTQDIEVYANTEQGNAGAVTKNQHIIVGE